MKYYEHDPLIRRVLGVTRLPDISTVCRSLANVDKKGIKLVQDFSRYHVIEQLEIASLSRVTADFDGSVITTKRYAENTAVGFNKKM